MKRAEVPTLRFPEFDDTLKFIEAGKLFRNRKQKGSTNLPLHSVTIDRGLIARKELDRNIISNTKPKQNLRALPQDLVYNMMRMWQGAIGYCETECMISPAYIVLNPIPDIESKFYYYFFKSHRGLHLLKSQSYGLTEDRLRLYYKDFKKVQLANPPKREQQKIADFLFSVDQKIQQLRRKKELLEEYKKGVMQKLFPKAGGQHPELRFKKENGDDFPDWEMKKLWNIAKKNSSSISANKLPENKGIYKMYGAGGFLQYVDFYEEDEPYISIVKDGAGVGRILLCDSFSSVLGTLDVIKPKGKNNVGFLYALLSRIRFEKYITGSTIPHIYFKDYSIQKVSVPHPDEQNRIANFIGSIDSKNKILQSMIDSTRTFKKGLLQQMFI